MSGIFLVWRHLLFSWIIEESLLLSMLFLNALRRVFKRVIYVVRNILPREMKDLREHSFFRRGGGVNRRNPNEHECKISQPSLYIFVKKCDPPPGSSNIYSDPPLPPDKHGLWLDCATIPLSFTQTHLLARITQPPNAYFSAITAYPGPFRQLIFLFTFVVL